MKHGQGLSLQSSYPETVVLPGGLQDLVTIYNEPVHLGLRRKVA